jgi:hypothetical protein
MIPSPPRSSIPTLLVFAALLVLQLRFVYSLVSERRRFWRAQRLSWLSIGHDWLACADECADLGADAETLQRLERRGIAWIAYAIGLTDEKPTAELS